MSATVDPMSRRERVLRIFAIVTILPAIAAFGVWQVGGFDAMGGWFGSASPSGPVPPALQPGLEGTPVGEPILSGVEGHQIRTQIYVSRQAPSAVIDSYSQHFQRSNYVRSLVEKAPPQSEAGRFGRWVAENNPQSFRVDSSYCSVVGARDPSGRDVGVIAYPSPEGTGSVYFVMEAVEPSSSGEGRFSPPVDPRNRIPAPPFSERRFHLQGLGEPGSTLTLYLARMGRSGIIDHYERELGQRGWSRRADQDAVVNRQLRVGHSVIFRRGPQELFLHLKEWSRGVEGVTILFRNKIR